MMSSCFDFWIVKNITGRFLIGLRWWSASDLLEEDFEAPPEKEQKYEELRDLNEEKNEESSDSDESDSEVERIEDAPLLEEWYFESYDADVQNSQVDAHIFWWSQCAITIYWLIFVVIKAISLSIFWVFFFGNFFSF